MKYGYRKSWMERVTVLLLSAELFHRVCYISQRLVKTVAFKADPDSIQFRSGDILPSPRSQCLTADWLHA